MRAAIYARRSTDEHQAESLEVQLGEAKRYCAGRGWVVDPQHIFEEDAVSRAEFKKRPALIRMLNAASAHEVDVIVVRDETRLGGDVTRTGLLIQEILDTGCDLVYYFTDERVKLDGAVDKFMVAARNFASELEREKISQRTREHLLTKARRGLNVGGRVFGYDNVRREDGSVAYEINEDEAAVIREIFQLYASGQGYRSIAQAFNDRGIPPPSAGKRGTGSWCPSCIRAILHRERYLGRLRWGTTHKTYVAGTKTRTKEHSCERVLVDVPELRIIDPELWETTRKSRRGGKRKGGRKPSHMLSGLARCAECGGPIKVEHGKIGNQKVKVYVCAYNRERGKSVCANTLRRPIDEINEAVAEWIRRSVLKEELVVEIVLDVRKRLAERAKSIGPDQEKLTANAAELRQQVNNLIATLQMMGPSKAVTERLAEKEAALSRVEASLEAAKVAPEVLSMETRRIEAEARARIAELEKLLAMNPAQARKVIESLFEGPITFTPEVTEDGKRRYRLRGEVAAKGLLPDALRLTSPGGFEPPSPA